MLVHRLPFKNFNDFFINCYVFFVVNYFPVCPFKNYCLRDVKETPVASEKELEYKAVSQ